MKKKIIDCSYREFKKWFNEKSWGIPHDQFILFQNVLSHFPKFYIRKKEKENLEFFVRLRISGISPYYEIEVE